MSLGKPLIVLFLIGAFVPFFFLGDGQVLGWSINRSDSQPGVAGGTSPAVLLVLFLVPFLLAKMPPVPQTLGSSAGLFRRFLSFVMDLYVGLFFSVSLAGCVSVAIEIVRERRLMWYFERDYLVGTDKVVGLPVLTALILLVPLYYIFPLTRGRQTLGDYVFGILVVKEDGRSAFSFKEAFVRTMTAFKGLCGGPIWGWKRDKQGRTWYDKETNCRVVRVKSADFEL